MKLNCIISIFLTICASQTFAATDYSDFRPRQMQEGSKLTIHFDNPKIFAEEGIVWEEELPGGYRSCHLQIKSYYDEDLAKSTKTAVYFISQVQGQSSLFTEENGYFKQDDQFNFWLSTENKNLPLLAFSCDMRVGPNVKKSFFTLADVEAFTGLDDIFLDPIYNETKPTPSISQSVPKKLALETFVDFTFKTEKRGNGFSVYVPYFLDGHRPKEGERAACSVRYRKSYESDVEGIKVLPKGQKATLYAAYELGFVIDLEFHISDGSSINLMCSSQNDVDVDLAYVRHHMGDAVKITEIVP